MRGALAGVLALLTAGLVFFAGAKTQQEREILPGPTPAPPVVLEVAPSFTTAEEICLVPETTLVRFPGDGHWEARLVVNPQELNQVYYVLTWAGSPPADGRPWLVAVEESRTGANLAPRADPVTAAFIECWRSKPFTDRTATQ